MGIFTVFDNIYTENIMGMWEKRRGFTPHTGVLLPSKLVSKYRCMNLPKTNDNDRTHKKDANTLSRHMINASSWTSAS